MAGKKATERERNSPGFELMGQQHPGTDGAREPGNAAFIPKCIKEKKCPLAAAGVITVLVIIIIALAAICSFFPAKKPEPCQSCTPPVDATCPDRWVGYQGKCYYTSEYRRNWSESETRCSVFGASLALIDNPLDLDFLVKLTRPHHYWIGLSREEGKAWRWTNGTEPNNNTISESFPKSSEEETNKLTLQIGFLLRFKVRGEGQCAYIDDNGLSSTWCFAEKTFLCNLPDACSRRRKLNLTQRDSSSTSI